MSVLEEAAFGIVIVTLVEPEFSPPPSCRHRGLGRHRAIPIAHNRRSFLAIAVVSSYQNTCFENRVFL